MCLAGSNAGFYRTDMGKAMGMRLRLTLKPSANSFFLYEGYLDDVVLFFRQLFNNEHVSVTDFLSSRKICTDKGIWLIGKSNLVICSPFLQSLMREIVLLSRKQLIIQENTLEITNVEICRQKTLYEGLLLSGVYSYSGSDYLEYENSPELFSECLRQNLLDIYRKINDQEEPEDKRFFISLNKAFKKQIILGKPTYRGIFEIFGSPELCNIFNQCFVTGRSKVSERG
jgi:CRISPR/Cas system endoribonuclease Cas6 (RAMP superfamily)